MINKFAFFWLDNTVLVISVIALVYCLSGYYQWEGFKFLCCLDRTLFVVSNWISSVERNLLETHQQTVMHVLWIEVLSNCMLFRITV